MNTLSETLSARRSPDLACGQSEASGSETHPEADSSSSAILPLIPKDPVSQSSRLLQLNDDLLIMIIDALRVHDMCKYDLRALSATCRYIRTICMLPLFGKCSVSVRDPVTREHMPPPSVWPYIRHLNLRNRRPHEELKMRSQWAPIFVPRRPIHYTPDAHLWAAFDPLISDGMLLAMPALRSISLHGHRDCVFDLSWAALKGILSIPHLREFKMVNHVIFCDVGNSNADNIFLVECLAPITSFVYDVGMCSVPPGYPQHITQRALAAIVPALAPSLQTLFLPTIYAPLKAIGDADWPLLRELTIRGNHWNVSHPPSAAALFANMPHLKSLNLELTRDAFQEQLSWPVVNPFPWPELEHLTLSNPDPDDAILPRLPLGLRSLSLYSWPSQTYELFLALGEPSWASWDGARIDAGVPLPSSTLLCVLRRFSKAAVDLTRLHVEYRPDRDEDSLLKFITTAFPSVRHLEVHRSPAELEHEQPKTDNPRILGENLETLAHAFASLTQLRELYIHTVLQDYPEQTWVVRTAVFFEDYDHITYAETVLLDIATAFASILAPSVESIAFLTPDNFWPRWAIYSVYVPHGSGERVVRYEGHRVANG